VFLRYLLGKKEWKVCDLGTREISKMRDVIFSEAHFLFASNTTSTEEVAAQDYYWKQHVMVDDDFGL